MGIRGGKESGTSDVRGRGERGAFWGGGVSAGDLKVREEEGTHRMK